MVLARSPDVSSVDGLVKIEARYVLVEGPAGSHEGLAATVASFPEAE